MVRWCAGVEKRESWLEKEIEVGENQRARSVCMSGG